MGGYLIPANSKKSLLYFGAFTISDLIIFGSGIAVTIVLLLILPLQNIWFALGAIAPGLVCGFLVFPIPNYHNMITIMRSIYAFYTTNQRFVWKGWCMLDGSEEKKQ